MPFHHEPLPTWQHLKPLFVNRFLSLRPGAGSSASGRAMPRAADPCLAALPFLQTAPGSSSERICTSHCPVLPLLNCKTRPLHAAVLRVLPLRYPTIFDNSGSRLRATSRRPRLGFPCSKARLLVPTEAALPGQRERQQRVSLAIPHLSKEAPPGCSG